MLADEPCIQLAWARPHEWDLSGRVTLVPVPDGSALYGVLNVASAAGDVAVRLPDGVYRDVLSGAGVMVRGGLARLPGVAYVLEVHEPFDATLWQSVLIDLHLHVEVLGDE